MTASGESQYSPLKRGRHARRIHERFGQAVRAQCESAILREQNHARAASDVVEEDAAGAHVERGSHEQPLRLLRHEEQHAARQHRNRDGDAAFHRHEQPQGEDAEHRAQVDGNPDRSLVTQCRNQQEAGRQRTDDCADRIPRIHARTGGRRVVGIAREDSHGEWIGHADRERHRQQQQSGKQRVVHQAGGTRQQLFQEDIRECGRKGRDDERRAERDGRALAVLRECRANTATERNAGEETGDHHAECVNAAADDVRQHAGPQHFLVERDRTREQHQRQHPGRSREFAQGMPLRARPGCLRGIERVSGRGRHGGCALGECHREQEYRRIERGADEDGALQSEVWQEQERREQRADHRAGRIHGVQQADASPDLPFVRHRVRASSGSVAPMSVVGSARATNALTR